MDNSKKGRIKYVLAMLCAWIGLYGVAILAMYTAGCSDDSRTASAPADSAAQTTPYTAIEAPEGTSITTQGEIVTLPETAREKEAPSSEPVVATPPDSSEPSPILTPEPTSSSYEDGERLYSQKQFAQAASVFGAYTSTRPSNLWGYYMLGLASWKSGDLSGAVAALEAALAIDSNHLKSHLNLARVQLETGDYSSAHRHALIAVDLAPERTVSHRILGRSFHNLGMAEEAIAAYRAALAINIDDAWSLNNIGLILIEEERFLESLGPLARAVELRRDVAAFRNNLGVALERTGRYEAAAEAYRVVLEIETGYSRAATSLARVEGLREEAGQQAWDLAMFAERFVGEIEAEAYDVREPELTEVTPR